MNANGLLKNKEKKKEQMVVQPFLLFTLSFIPKNGWTAIHSGTLCTSFDLTEHGFWGVRMAMKSPGYAYIYSLKDKNAAYLGSRGLRIT